MRTLVIHPTDQTTDFLSVIYEDWKDWTVIRDNVSKKVLKNAIKTHEKVILLGHGTEDGLLGHGRIFINSEFVYLLRNKWNVYIWCNADEFVKKYKLAGFYTGMILSEVDEVDMFCNFKYTFQQLQDSNKLFANAIKIAITQRDMLYTAKWNYPAKDNPIITYNLEHMYQNELPQHIRVKVIDEDDKIVGMFNYIEFLQFKLQIITKAVKGNFYIQNKYGGKDEIDKFGNIVQGDSPFNIVNELLREIIKAQTELKKGETPKLKFEIGKTYPCKIGLNRTFTINNITYKTLQKDQEEPEINIIWGTYNTSPHLTNCPINPDRLILQ